MLYKVVKKFGPEDGERWLDYLQWRKLELTRFDSLDDILRPSLFSPETEEDWKYCVQEDFKLSFLTNLDHARKICAQNENSEIVGVEFPTDTQYQPQKGLLGYDIIDAYWDVSLLTDWGTQADAIFSGQIMTNGLLGDLSQAFRIRDALRNQFPDDAHACECEVCAIYKIDV